MLRDLDYYASATREAIHNDDARDDIYGKIHEAATSQFQNPKELRDLPWIQERKFVNTAPADALNAAIRTFAAHLPDLQIQPLSDAQEEYDRTEQLESLMKWEFQRMNQLGKKSPHWKIVEYAMKYCAVAIETEYLPYVYQGQEKTPRVKEILRGKNFKWNIHDPSTVHARESEDLLEMVVVCDVMTAQQVVDTYGRDNPGVQDALGTIDQKDPRAMNNMFFSVYKYTDWDARVIWITDNGGMTYINRDAPTGFEILRKERTIPFLPWVFVDNEEPLLKQMIVAGLWDNVNILRTMQFSKSVDMAAHPEYWIQTPDGSLRGVHIDQSNPNQPIVTGPGVQVNQLRPPVIDPQLANMVMTAEQEVFRTTVAQILASVERYAGTQNFSVVNAMLSAALAQLSLAKMAAERAETMAMLQNFRWIHETDIPMVGFRPYSKGEGKPKGQELVVQKGDFDPDYLYLSVKLTPSTIMDKQTDINNAINKVERLGMSKKMAWDELGMEGYELSETQTAEELLYLSHVQAKSKEILMAPDLKAAQMQQQMQQGMEQTQFSGQQGMDNRAGGATATMPGQGREQLNGQTDSGQEIV